MAQLRYIGLVQDILEKWGEEVSLPPDASVTDLLDCLSNKYGDDFRYCVMTDNGSKLRPNAGVFIGDRNVEVLEGLATKVPDDAHVDIVVILHPITGG